jgi:O-antigen ligase
MLGPVIALVALSLALGWAMLNRAGIYPADWSVSLAALGAISFGYWQFSNRRDRAPALPIWLQLAIWALPTYIALQLIPLPLALLEFLSPARAQLAQALAPVIPGIRAAPLSSNIPATILGLFTILGYVGTFFLVRELAWRWVAHCWLPVMPLLILSGWEAGLGCYQFVAGDYSRAFGTYTNTNYDHFSGLLEMALPIAALWGASLFTRSYRRGQRSKRLLIAACSAWALAGLLLVGIVCSLSRAGFIIALCTLFLVAGLGIGFHLGSRTSRRAALLGAAVVIVFLAVALPADPLIGKLSLVGTESSGERNSIDSRMQLWQQTIPLVHQFPVFGCGLGAYESNFLQYQAVAYAYRIQFAHNDYLQSLTELGFAGFGIILAILYGVMSQIFKGMFRLMESERRLLVIACGGGLGAILLHSLVDVNMHIPANAMTAAWIAALGSINGLD